jgi:hypothetical protein
MTDEILIVGVFCLTNPVRKSAVRSKLDLIFGVAFTAATAAASSGA